MPILSKAMMAALGAAEKTRDAVEKGIDDLIARGELEKSKRSAAVAEALDRFESEAAEAFGRAKKSISEKVREFASGQLSDEFATRAEFDKLDARLRAVEDQLAALKSSLGK